VETVASRYAGAAQALKGAADRVLPDVPDGEWPTVIAFPDRQKQAMLADIGRAILRTAPDGDLVVIVGRREGAARAAGALAELGEVVSDDSVARCRVLHLRGPFNRSRATEFAQLDGPQQLESGLWTRPGLFGWDGGDLGTPLLVKHLPPRMGRKMAELGAGWGRLAQHLLTREGLAELHLIEHDHRAIDMLKRNMDDPRVKFVWDDATTATQLGRFDTVVMNPPFHQGAKTKASLGQAFILRARAMMHPRSHLWLVANAHLPYEKTLGQQFGRVETVERADGFKVIHASKPR